MARIRLSDKLSRFKSLSRAGNEQKVNDESIEDTLLDLANYAIMTVMEMRLEKKDQEIREKTKCKFCDGELFLDQMTDRFICDNCGRPQ